MSSPRPCACGCPLTLEGRRPDARYATDACRARAWKRRNHYGRPNTRSNGSQSTSARRSGASVRISYRKALAATADYLERRTLLRDPNAVAETILEPLLTDRQRKALHG